MTWNNLCPCNKIISDPVSTPQLLRVSLILLKGAFWTMMIVATVYRVSICGLHTGSAMTTSLAELYPFSPTRELRFAKVHRQGWMYFLA